MAELKAALAELEAAVRYLMARKINIGRIRAVQKATKRVEAAKIEQQIAEFRAETWADEERKKDVLLGMNLALRLVREEDK